MITKAKLIPFSKYEEALQAVNVTPNFFVSERYWLAAGWVCTQEADLMIVRDEEGLQVLPSIGPKGLVEGLAWSDFPGYVGIGMLSFLDYQFIYDPASFSDLSGGSRAVFRKNVRRFDRDHTEWEYRRPVSCEEMIQLLGEWLQEGEEVYGLETILAYLEACSGDESRVLTIGGKPVAMTAWDSNWAYINFRYCFADRSVKYSSEFVRLQFYLDMISRHKGKTVNDGGALGNLELMRFKNKMGPVRVDSIYSWKETKDG